MFPSPLPPSLPAAPSFMSLLPSPSTSGLALLGFPPPPPPALMTSQPPAAFTANHEMLTRLQQELNTRFLQDRGLLPPDTSATATESTAPLSFHAEMNQRPHHLLNNATNLPQIYDGFSTKLGGLTSSLSTVDSPVLKMSSCPSSFALAPGVSVGAFQPTAGSLSLNSASQLLLALRDRDQLPASGGPALRLSPLRKRGRWCAAHVHLARSIHARRQSHHLADNLRTTTDQFHREGSTFTDVRPPPLGVYDTSRSSFSRTKIRRNQENDSGSQPREKRSKLDQRDSSELSDDDESGDGLRLSSSTTPHTHAAQQASTDVTSPSISMSFQGHTSTRLPANDVTSSLVWLARPWLLQAPRNSGMDPQLLRRHEANPVVSLTSGTQPPPQRFFTSPMSAAVLKAPDSLTEQSVALPSDKLPPSTTNGQKLSSSSAILTPSSLVLPASKLLRPLAAEVPAYVDFRSRVVAPTNGHTHRVSPV